MVFKLPAYRKREDAICEKIREIIDEYDRLDKVADAAEVLRRLEEALEEYAKLRREYE